MHLTLKTKYYTPLLNTLIIHKWPYAVFRN